MSKFSHQKNSKIKAEPADITTIWYAYVAQAVQNFTCPLQVKEVHAES